MMTSFIFFRSEEPENIRHQYIQLQENTSPTLKQSGEKSGAVLRHPFNARSLDDLCLMPRGRIRDDNRCKQQDLHAAKIRYVLLLSEILFNKKSNGIPF
jgi:hypothetical protein